MRHLFVWLILLSFSCGAVRAYRALPKLSLPDDIESAPASQRIELYEKWKPVNATETIIVDQYGNQKGNSVIASITLKDGTEIHSLEQIFQLVPAESYTGQQIRRSQKLQKRALIWLAGFPSGFVLSIPFIVAGKPLAIVGRPPNSDVFIGVGIGLIAAGFLSLFGMSVPQIRSNKARDRAMLSFEKGLMESLRLCQSGDSVFDCEEGAPVPFVVPDSALESP